MAVLILTICCLTGGGGFRSPPPLRFYRTAWNADAVAMIILSVRLFVKREHCDKTEERSVHILYYTNDHWPSFLKRRMVGGGDPFYL